MNSVLGKILYFILFAVILPLLFFTWAIKTESTMPLPALDFPIPGMALAVVGFIVMVSGMLSLYIYGHGLPMNPFPPEKHVTRGIYKLLEHPIYIGAGMLAVGISFLVHSASGLWLISSVLILGCVALVLGYEKEDLLKRFGRVNFKPLISLPDASEQKATISDKISTYVLVFIPWAVIHLFVIFSGAPESPILSYLPFESNIPVYEFTVLFITLIYLLIFIIPFLLKTKKEIREFMISALMVIGIGTYFNILFPFITLSKLTIAESFCGKLIEFTKVNHVFYMTFPAFPLIWASIAALFYQRRFPSLKFLWKVFPVLIALSCVASGIFSLIDVVSAYLVFLLVKYRGKIWQFITRFSESLANSWKEWQLGPVRIINHGFYAGTGTAVGAFIVGMLIGTDNLPAIFLVTVTSVICAALWAQIIEGSAKLLRPMGYYGGVIGIIIGSFLAHFIFGTDIFLLLAAFSVAGPWIQSLGRLRCLVQGCCHGRVTTPNIGIRHWHERSRVCRIANLKNEYLYPTPVYSILSNIIIGLFLIKLWFVGAPLPLITGLYLILPGLCRFVEEAYRGEPQTPIVWGLRLYQWMAIISIIIGAVITTIPHQLFPVEVQFSTNILFVSIVLGLIATFATGVDFPYSNKRFSRLV